MLSAALRFIGESLNFRMGIIGAQIPADNLNDAVEVNVFARATRAIDEYRVSAAHPDYGNMSLNWRKATS